MHAMHRDAVGTRSTSRSTASLPGPANSVTERIHLLSCDVGGSEPASVGADAGQASPTTRSRRGGPGCRADPAEQLRRADGPEYGSGACGISRGRLGADHAARHADPRTTMNYDRARKNLDRHPNCILAAYMASDTCRIAWL